MSPQIVALRVAGTVFGLMCLAQLARLVIFSGADIVFAGHRLPLWPSALAGIVLAALSVWMWKVSYGPR
jgi:hypothetical protein